MKLSVVFAVPRFIEPDLLVQCVLFNVRQDEYPPTVKRVAIFINGICRWKRTVGIVVIVECEG